MPEGNLKFPIKERQPMDKLVFEIVAAIQSAIDAREPMAAGRSTRVAEYAVKIGKALGFKKEHLEKLRLAALLQDVGKIGMPDSILSKPGPLTEEEVKVIRKHVVLSEKYLSEVKELKEILPWITHHHERWDGRGYPAGLKGEEIPLEARILAVADSLEAMTANRVYRKAIPWPKVKEILRDGAGKQWNPEIVKIALKVFKRPIDTGIVTPEESRVLEQIRMESSLAQWRLLVLYEIANIIRNSSDFEEIITRSLLTLHDNMGYEYLGIFVVNEVGNFIPFAVLGVEPEGGEITYTQDSEKLAEKIIESIRKQNTNIAREIVIPISSGTHVVGAIYVGKSDTQPFDPDDIRFFETAASYLSSLLWFTPSVSFRPILIEPSTGLYHLSSVSYRIKMREKFSVAYMRIKGLDEVALRYGEGISKIVRREFVNEMKRTITRSDILTSIGQDELILVSEKSKSELERFLEWFKKHTSGMMVKVGVDMLPLPDFKYGVVEFNPEEDKQIDFNALVQKAIDAAND